MGIIGQVTRIRTGRTCVARRSAAAAAAEHSPVGEGGWSVVDSGAAAWVEARCGGAAAWGHIGGTGMPHGDGQGQPPEYGAACAGMAPAGGPAGIIAGAAGAAEAEEAAGYRSAAINAVTAGFTSVAASAGLALALALALPAAACGSAVATGGGPVGAPVWVGTGI